MMPISAKTGRWLVLLGLLCLSSCSIFKLNRPNKPMELVDFTATVKLDKVWSRGIGDGQSEGSSIVPAIDGDNIYAVDYTGQLVAMNAATGKKLWSRKINQPKLGVWGWVKSFFVKGDANYQIVGGIGAENGLLLVSTYKGEVLALDEATGAELWRHQAAGEILSAPHTNGSVVAAQTMTGSLIVLNAKTGEQLWFYENPAPILTLRGTSSPIVTDTAIYVGFSNGRMMAFNPSNGLILWERRIALPKGRTELDRMVDIHATPLIQGGIMYVGTFQGRIEAIARGTGNPIWGVDGSTSEVLTVAGGKLFVSDSQGKVQAYNSASGELLWTNDKMLRRNLGGPQVIGDYVAVVDFAGYMHLLNQSDGEFAARIRVDRKGARAPMLNQGGLLYVSTNGGKLLAFKSKSKK